MQSIIQLLQSRTVLAALVASIASVLAIFNIDFGLTPEKMDPIYNGLAALGGLLAVVFRGVATKKIGGGSLE